MNSTMLTTVSIAIPAHNEESTIKELLTHLIHQKSSGFVLKEIIVLSDCSDDNTVKHAKSVDDPRIKIVETPEYMGQNSCQNTLFRMAEGDIVVFMEAHMIPNSPHYIAELVAPIMREEVCCTYGATEPWLSTHGLGSLFYFVESAKVLAYRQLRRGRNIFTCHSGKAIRKLKAPNLNWPPDTAEDAYFYLFGRYTLRSIQFVHKAVLYYHVPSTLLESIKESVRFTSSKRILGTYFSPKIIRKEYSFSGSVFVTFITTLLRKPHICAAYILLVSLSRFLSLFISTKTPSWKTVQTPKIRYRGV